MRRWETAEADSEMLQNQFGGLMRSYVIFFCLQKYFTTVRLPEVLNLVL
jgi:hypothetical protein